MRRMIGPLLLATSLALLAAAPPAPGFSCGKLACNCKGTQDCADMRHSSQCDGTVTCGTDTEGDVVCGCAAAKVGPGGGNSGHTGRPIKQAPIEAPPPASAQPP